MGFCTKKLESKALTSSTTSAAMPLLVSSFIRSTISNPSPLLLKSSMQWSLVVSCSRDILMPVTVPLMSCFLNLDF
uniref:Uncharacterized protein LOC8262870 isoform X2 n=1 Tax=Rhizophora mucronata TaxID=61149 RepID=A0A2P2J3X5_RHIMU